MSLNDVCDEIAKEIGGHKLAVSALAHVKEMIGVLGNHADVPAVAKMLVTHGATLETAQQAASVLLERR